VTESRSPGLRVILVVALAILMALAFVPLYFAVAELARATLLGAREQAAVAMARSAAAHVRDARAASDPAALRRALASHAGRDGVETLCAYGPGGAREACAGDEALLPSAPPAVYRDDIRRLREGPRPHVEVLVPIGNAVVLARVRTDEATALAGPLVGLVGIYMATFALALLVFAYFFLTRLIVRPIDQLARAADRVATGARTFTAPRSGALEIDALGRSVQQMTSRLVAEEAALRAKIEELTLTSRRLGETKEQLVRSERLASVGRLAAGIAHEIGNPIAALMGMEDLLLDGDLPGETQKDFLERMKRETNRIHTVVRDLLDFARPERAREAPSSAPASLAATVDEVFEDVAALLRPQRQWKGIALTVEVDSPDVKVRMAPDKLTQVILNLAMNAGDALASRAPREADMPTGRVALRAQRRGDRVVLQVEDDGPGVPPSLRERVFEPFVTTKDVGRGTGLGLAVCRGLVESADGVIGIDTSYESGARFIIDLPSA